MDFYRTSLHKRGILTFIFIPTPPKKSLLCMNLGWHGSDVSLDCNIQPNDSLHKGTMIAGYYASEWNNWRVKAWRPLLWMGLANMVTSVSPCSSRRHLLNHPDPCLSRRKSWHFAVHCYIPFGRKHYRSRNQICPASKTIDKYVYTICVLIHQREQLCCRTGRTYKIYNIHMLLRNAFLLALLQLQ